MKISFFAAAAATLACVVSGSTFSPARPPAIPLAVKSPYMQTWLEVGSDDGGSGGILPGYWPRFWAGPQPGAVAGPNGAVTGWAGLIRVDGTTYTWMGAPEINSTFPLSVTQLSFEYTSTRSTFVFQVEEKLSMNVTFLSPLTPNDLKRQSVIASYLHVNVTSIDGVAHAVQLYSDISAEWVTEHDTDSVQWNYTTYSGVASHQVFRTPQSEFNADYADDGSHWGNWYYSTSNAEGMTFQSGADQTVRGLFINNGELADTQDTDYRAIDDDYPVFGYARDLGNLTGSSSVLYTITHAQQNAIYFDGANGLTSVPSLWTSYWSSDLDMINFFYEDWSNETGQTDFIFERDSLAAGGQDYLTITSLSARQAFAGVQLCGNTSKPYLFLKEISSDGNIQTVDVIFPTIPIFLYSNPVLVKYLLDPLFENQEAGQFPQTYSIHDLGSSYPRAIGHTDGGGEEMPIEECGNMLITTLAYVQRSGDTAYLSQHYDILKQWTGYLVNGSLIPANQLSTDDFQGNLANQTNLALKGIIGIEAMAVISNLTGNTDDANNYSTIAHDYITRWQILGINQNATTPHTTLAYGNETSYGLLYNLYADALLGLDLVPQSVYDMQSTFYPTVVATYGVPLDTRNAQTKSDWSMWTAAIASEETKTMFISKLATWINETTTNRALTDLYETDTGDFGIGPFIARPVVGGHFALLALDDAPTSASVKRAREEREFCA